VCRRPRSSADEDEHSASRARAQVQTLALAAEGSAALVDVGVEAFRQCVDHVFCVGGYDAAWISSS
jgi:hypothetical protein